LISRPFPLVLISNFLLSQKFSTKLLASSTLVFALASYTRAHVKLEKIKFRINTTCLFCVNFCANVSRHVSHYFLVSLRHYPFMTSPSLFWTWTLTPLGISWDFQSGLSGLSLVLKPNFYFLPPLLTPDTRLWLGHILALLDTRPTPLLDFWFCLVFLFRLPPLPSYKFLISSYQDSGLK